MAAGSIGKAGREASGNDLQYARGFWGRGWSGSVVSFVPYLPFASRSLTIPTLP